MNEFLTWNHRIFQQWGVYEWFVIVAGTIFLVTVFGFLFYHFGKLIGWIDRKFFTVHEWELDMIDEEYK